MSHLLQRKEKDCLNCGSIVLGRYCQNCGQENIEPKESVWQLASHFFSDITHFDGKFFSTLKDLLFKPGFLSKQYIIGKRVKYLNPIRMYLFTSFIFFLLFFSLYHVDEKQFNNKIGYFGKTPAQVEQMPQKEFATYTSSLNKGKPMSRNEYSHFIDSVKKLGGIHFTNQQYKNKAEYDSLLKTGKKQNWFKRKLIYKYIDINSRFANDQAKLLKEVVSTFIHDFPQMLFISLPFIALFLELLYIRHKQFYFVSHAIFTIHFFIFVFIMMFGIIGVSKLKNLVNWDWVGYINGVITIAIFFYLYKAMRNYYGQRRAKTILKYFLFLFSFFILILFLLTTFFFVSIFQV